MPAPGTVIELRVEKPAVGGRMIARHEGLVVLVSGAIPGERVRAVVERTGQGLAYAATIDVLEASPDRRAVAGNAACGGNVYAHIAYDRQVLLKGETIADGLTRIGRIPLGAPVPVTSSPEQGYRMRARFHVRGRQLGFFLEGTHELCDPGGTGQLLPSSAELVKVVGGLLREGRLAGVTEIDLAENVPATERALHLEFDRDVGAGRLAELARLPTMVGVSAAVIPGGRGGKPGWRRVISSGTACVLDTLELDNGKPGFGIQDSGFGRNPESSVQVRLQHNARAFFQGNRYLLATLASRVLSLVPAGPVLDLYAGVGLFSASLAAAGWTSIVAVEGDRAAAADLRANASPFGRNLEAVEAPVERYLASHPPGPDTTIVVDPPRTGMSKEASAAIAGQAARRVVYVSCDVATLARDARRLLDAGYRLEQIEGFDLFPNTAHVEALAVFTSDKPR